MNYLANRAACEVVNLHLDDKSPCERYQAVLEVVLRAMAEMREMLLE